MIYRYPLHNADVRTFLEAMHLSASKVNWIVNDRLYNLDGDTLVLDSKLFNEKEVVGVNLPLEVLYQDEYLLVVNKPKGMIIYSDDPKEVTLDKVVAGYLAGIGKLPVPRHIYRLDKDTSGIMLYAMDPLTLSYLSFLNENRLLDKTYYALCHGKLPKKNGVIDRPIGRNRHDAHKMMISNTGQKAVTNYEVLSETDAKSLVALNLVTGRTHQIRVHMSSLGHPVVGDKLYGIDDGYELQLEVAHLSLIHPITKQNLTIELPKKLTL